MKKIFIRIAVIFMLFCIFIANISWGALTEEEERGIEAQKIDIRNQYDFALEQKNPKEYLENAKKNALDGIQPGEFKDRVEEMWDSALEKLDTVLKDNENSGTSTSKTDVENFELLYKRFKDEIEPAIKKARTDDEKVTALGRLQNILNEMSGYYRNMSKSDQKKYKDKYNEVSNLASSTELSVSSKTTGNKIFKQPNIVTGDAKKDGTLDDMISDAGSFVSKGDQTAVATIETDGLKDLSGRLYNILLEIGIGAAVLIGIILGIKFLLSGVEEKAQVKKMIWVYSIGCIVTFGAFGIWKIVVTILQQV